MDRIITSLLDTDMYKFYMGQYVWKYFPNVKVKYKFFNRTDVKLIEFIKRSDLLNELNNVKNLKFTLEDLHYLYETEYFSKEYIAFLSNLNLPPVFISEEEGKLVIETEGKWCEAIFWETFILSIVNELYYKHWSHNKAGYLGEFEERLNSKIKKIKENPFKFIEFGTRRRFSKEIQDQVIYELCDKYLHYQDGSLVGTSNVYFAKKYELKPIGTMAHELPMVLAGIYDDNLITLKNSHNKMLTLWEYMYGEDLSIALTDTFGTKFFFENFTKEKAENWKGLRQDSGDPFKFAQSALEFYRKMKVNSKDKLIVFSDGLDINKILKLEKEVRPYFKTAYGWGTNLTNDIGYKPISIVVKAVEANGKPLVKLSDNLAKSLGEPKVIEKYKKAFGYESNYTEPLYY